MFKEFYEFAVSEVHAKKEEYENLEREKDGPDKDLDKLAEVRAEMIEYESRLTAYVAACSDNPYTCPI